MRMNAIIAEWEEFATKPVLRELESIKRLIDVDGMDDEYAREHRFMKMWNSLISRYEDSFIEKKSDEYMDMYNMGRMTLKEYRCCMTLLAEVRQIWAEERNVED
jgi:hypothetical protein